MEREIMKADSQYRKKVLRNFLIIFVGGSLFLALLLPYFNGYLQTLNCAKQAQILLPIFIILFSIPCISGFYFLRIALRAYKQGQFPPQGMKVIKDTPVFRGSAAKNISAALIFLAVFIILLCIFGMGFSLMILLRSV